MISVRYADDTCMIPSDDTRVVKWTWKQPCKPVKVLWNREREIESAGARCRLAFEKRFLFLESFREPFASSVLAMAAIAADAGREKGWGRVVSFSLPAGSGYVEKARQAATSTVQVLWSTTEVAWSTGKAAWSAGASLLVAVVPFRSKLDQDLVDLEGGAPVTPRS